MVQTRVPHLSCVPALPGELSLFTTCLVYSLHMHYAVRVHFGFAAKWSRSGQQQAPRTDAHASAHDTPASTRKHPQASPVLPGGGDPSVLDANYPPN